NPDGKVADRTTTINTHNLSTADVGRVFSRCHQSHRITEADRVAIVELVDVHSTSHAQWVLLDPRRCARIISPVPELLHPAPATVGLPAARVVGLGPGCQPRSHPGCLVVTATGIGRRDESAGIGYCQQSTPPSGASQSGGA